jgi:hypothetical protein
MAVGERITSRKAELGEPCVSGDEQPLDFLWSSVNSTGGRSMAAGFTE